MPERQTKATQGRHERMLLELLKIPGNDQCADCNSKHPRWASYSLGIFLCIRCAGLHRKMGTHISRVKSVTMDEWTLEQIDMIRKSGGNRKVNSIVNPHPDRHPLPLAEEDNERAMEKYIRSKWEKRAFMDAPVALPKEVPAKPPVHAHGPPKRSASEPVVVNDRGQYVAALAKLHEMGFRNEQQNREVLRHTHGNIAAALDILSRLPGAQKPVLSGQNMSDDQKMAILQARGFTNVADNQDALRRSAGNLDVAIGILESSKKAASQVTTTANVTTSLSAFSSPPPSQELAGRAQSVLERQAHKLAGAQTNTLLHLDDCVPQQPQQPTNIPTNTTNPFFVSFDQQPQQPQQQVQQVQQVQQQVQQQQQPQQQQQQLFFSANTNPFGQSSPALTNMSATSSGPSVQPQLTGFVQNTTMAPASHLGGIQSQVTGIQQSPLGQTMGFSQSLSMNPGPLTPTITGSSNPFSQMATGHSMSVPNTPSNMFQDRFGYFTSQPQQQPFSSSTIGSSPLAQSAQTNTMPQSNPMQPSFTGAIPNQQTGFQTPGNIFSTAHTFANSNGAASNPMMSNKNPWATSQSSFF